MPVTETGGHNNDMEVVVMVHKQDSGDGEELVCPKSPKVQYAMYLLTVALMVCSGVFLIVNPNTSLMDNTNTDTNDDDSKSFDSWDLSLLYGVLASTSALLVIGVYMKKVWLVCFWPIAIVYYMITASTKLSQHILSQLHSNRGLNVWDVGIVFIYVSHFLITFYVIVCIVRFVYKQVINRKLYKYQELCAS